MKLFYLLTIIVFPLAGITQETLSKSFEPFTAIDGTIYNVGDTIKLGAPADYSNEFKYVSSGQNFSNKMETVSYLEIGGRRQKIDNRRRFGVIKFFRVNPKNGKTYAVLYGLIKSMIEINSAIQTGEIFTKELTNSFLSINSVMTDTVAFLKYMGLKEEITNDNAREYIYLFDRKRYNEIRNDEFEFFNEISKTKDYLKSKNPTQQKKAFQSILYFELGKYDFDKKGFPVLWDTTGTCEILNDIFQGLTPTDLNNEKIDLTDLRFEFLNFKTFDFLEVNQMKANNFVKHRKNFIGNVDRKVRAIVHFEIDGLKSLEEKSSRSNYHQGEFHFLAKITQISFFEDEEFYYWLGNN